MTPQHIETMFARLAAADPAPETELAYVNAYTLLVAVVLSAQSTDVGVNKATAKLFEKVQTPQAMLDLGEEGLRQHIRTIGLFNTKAKNVIALCASLVANMAARCRTTAMRSKRCPALAARPPMSCSTSPSVPKPALSIRMFSASPTAPDWRRARSSHRRGRTR